MKSHEYDIIILGFGPAGIYTAREFLKSRYNVLVIDNKKVTVSVIATFCDAIYKDIEGAVVAYYNILVHQNQFVKIARKGEGKKRLALVDIEKLRKIVRDRIDFDYADAEITGFEREHGKIMLRGKKGEEYLAKIVIDCSGSNSILAKPFAAKNECSYYGYAFTARNCNSVNSDEFVIYNSPDYTSNCLWIYPYSSKTAQVGILEMAFSDPDPEKIEKKLWKGISEVPLFSKYFKGCSVDKKTIAKQRYPIRLRKLVDDNILFVGNSGGQAVPFIGECLRQSAALSKIAAKTAKNAVDNDNFSKRFLSEYSKEWKRAFGRYYLWGRLASFVQARLDEKMLGIVSKRVAKLNDTDFFSLMRSEITLRLLLKCLPPSLIFYLITHLRNPAKLAK